MKSADDALPTSQVSHASFPPRLNFPSSHDWQPVFAALTLFPAAHVKQLDASAALYEPTVHDAHVEGPPIENVPAAQASQPVLSKFVLFPAPQEVQ